MKLRKVTSLVAILRRDPREFVERVVAIAEGRVEPLRATRPAYDALDWSEAAVRLGTALGARFTEALAEPELEAVERAVRAGIARLAERAPYTLTHNADFDLARCCYAACRALGARTVVETGVGYGVTTAFVLQALDVNGAGELRSIDLPPLERGAEDYAGVLVPRGLRARWRLHRGMSRRVLPRVLAETGPIDLFVHDSMHTLENMRFELGQAWLRLAQGGALVADDIEGNAAFSELADGPATFAVAVRQSEKPALFGVAVK